MSIEIRFLKNHINWKLGDETNVDDTQGQYLIRCHVAEPVDMDPVKTEQILLNHLEENKPDHASEVNTAGDMSIAENFPGAVEMNQEVGPIKKKPGRLKK